MAFNNRKSWRLRYIDIDNSFVFQESEDEIIGYFAVRAPKGNQRPTYFPKENGGAIDALIGVGSADWPDIVEAKQFNEEYPCYISAAPGSSKSYKSHLGGFYLTKDGIYKFYNVESKLDLENGTGNAFQVKVKPGREELFKPEFETKKTTVVVSGPTLKDFVPTEKDVGYGFISFKESDTYSISFKKNSNLDVTAIDYDTMRQGLVSSAGTDTTYWGDDEGLWSFSGNVATLVNFGRNYSGEELANPDFNALRDWIGSDCYKIVGNDMAALAELLVNGYFANGNDACSIAFGIQDTFSFMVDIQDDVLAYWMQKSCTEAKTTINITDIGYDKYYYEKLLNYAPYKMEDGRLLVDESAASLNALEKAQLKEALESNEYIGFYDASNPEKGIMYIGKRNDDESTEDKIVFSISDDLNTRYLAFQNNLVGGRIDSIFHKFYKPVSGKDVRHILTEEEEIAIWGTIDGPLNYENGVTDGTAVPVNPIFNQISISCSEEIYAGKTTSGGSVTGSLDELGVNTFGNTNFFPEVMSDDDFSFLEVRVLRKIGDRAGDLDETGFWNYSRLIDPYDIDKDGLNPTQKKFTVEGDRYCTLVMEQNKALGKLGGDWNDNYRQILADSLEEATLGEYDDAYIFVECTGQECFKPALAKICKVQENGAVFSPKLIEPNAKGIVTDTIASKLVVTDRTNEGCNALFAGEFEVLDEITKKKYWRKPIGAVALMIARIYEKKYGGAAPAWTNENGLGGQLDVKAIRSRYQLDSDAEKTLDKKGVNPIVMTSQEGVMIISQKTNRDPNMLSDWSYIGHACSFLMVRRQIRDNVMRDQVMKPINPYYMSKRQTQVDAILSKRLSGDSPVWDAATCDIAGVNTAYTKAQKDFVIEVAITCTPFSETVTLRMVHNIAEKK